MIRTGYVKEKKGDSLVVSFERPASCEGCKGCAKGLMNKNESLIVFGEANVGDIVDVQMPQDRGFQASLLAYALPLCGLILGLLAGYMLKWSDTASFMLALLGLAGGFALGRGTDKLLRKRRNWCPSDIQVYPGTACTAEERNNENE